MSVPLVIGCPVHRRQWCLERWFDSVETQDPPEGTRMVFLLSEPGDPSERIILRRWPAAEVLYAEGLPSFGEDEKDHPSRYMVLAHLRNRLLRAVQALEPERYLSWDSDILLRPSSLAHLLAVREDAAGALTDMGGEVHPGHWSWMTLEGNDAHRAFDEPLPPTRPRAYVFAGRGRLAYPTGVIMGVKLLSPRAYRSVRYADHVLGEDVGWAIQAEAVGVERWLVPAARGKHLYRLEEPREGTLG